MSKVLAVVISGLLAASAYAQGPAETSGEQGNVTNTKSQQRAEARKDARPAGMVTPAAGDTAKTPEGGVVGTDKAAAAGEKRIEKRDKRRPNRKPAPQGGTPDAPGAK